MQTRLKNLLFSSVLATSTLCMAQGAEQSPTPPQPPASEQAPSAPAGVQKWIQQLGSDSYRDRLEAENALQELGEQALPALREAARQTDDGEVQWRARRLLRRIEGGGRRPGGLVERRRAGDAGGEAGEPSTAAPMTPRSGPRAPRGLEEMQRDFDRLFERFERDFGLDIPRRRFFDDTFFNDLRSQMQGRGQSRGTSIQIGPDGVRMEVQEQGEDGELESKVYEAPDMKTFREQYPDVLKDNGLGIGIDPLGFDLDHVRARIGQVQPGFDPDDFGPGVLLDPADPRVQHVSPVPPEGRRLGVLIKEVPPQVREYLDLGDQGLMIQEVQAGTLAEALGLTRDDIVLRIGDRDIGSPADVQQALGAIGVGETVSVEYVRKGRRQTATTEKRKDAAPAREVLQPRSAEKDAPKVR